MRRRTVRCPGKPLRRQRKGGVGLAAEPDRPAAGLSFVPGVQAGITSGLSGFGEGIAGAAGAEFGGMLGSRLLGGAGALLLLSGASEALSPQSRRDPGQESSQVSASAPTGEGAAIPLVYGTVRLTAPPVVSAGLSVEVMQP